MEVLYVIKTHCIIEKTKMGIKEQGVGTHPVLQEGSWSRFSPCRSQLYIQASLDQRFYSDVKDIF